MQTKTTEQHRGTKSGVENMSASRSTLLQSILALIYLRVILFHFQYLRGRDVINYPGIKFRWSCILSFFYKRES